jgi:hypothetical protein
MNAVQQANRKRDLAEIHVLKKHLQLDEDAYRDLMATVCAGVRSAGELDFAGRARFIEHLRRCAGGVAPRKLARRSGTPLSKKQALIWSLWQRLADAHQVASRDRKALSAFVKRQTGVDQLTWLNGAQEDLVIESLKRWLERGLEPA